MKRLISLSLALLAAAIILAQQKPTFKPTYYQDTVSGRLYWNKNLPVYLNISPSPNTKGVLLKSKTTPQYTNPFYFDTECINFIRSKWAVDKKTKKVVPNVEVMFEVYADGIPPLTTASIIDKYKFFRHDTLFCGKNLSIKLSPHDNCSGVKQTFVSINSKPFKPYSTPIKITSQGPYTIKFFSVDHVNNVEKTRQIKFVADFQPPKAKAIIVGVYLAKRDIISPTTKIFILAHDNSSGIKKITYKIDSLPEKIYQPKTSIPIAQLSDGNHTIWFHAVDNVNNSQPWQKISFYLDKTAPITIADVLGDKFVVNGKVYFSGRTKMKLTSVDNKSGVKAVYYSVDNKPFKKYTKPFYLPLVPGWHVIKFFALDSTENYTGNGQEKYLQYRMKVDKVYMDLTGPSLFYSVSQPKFIRNDTIFISPKTKIILSAVDKESGLKSIAYSLDKNKLEIKYSKPFTLNNLPEGQHTITEIGYDNVNNRNERKFKLFLDNKPPQIFYTFGIRPIATKDSLPVYPHYTKLFLSFSDDYTGISQIFYSLNNSPLTPYKNYISGFKHGLNIVKIIAKDKVGNQIQKIIKFYIQ